MSRSALWLVVLASCRSGESRCDDAVHHLQDHIKLPANADTAVLGRLGQRCSEDDWPSDAIRCVRDATSPAEFETCMKLLSASQRAKLERFVVGVSKTDIAKIAVSKYANEAFASWAAAHPDKACLSPSICVWCGSDGSRHVVVVGDGGLVARLLANQ